MLQAASLLGHHTPSKEPWHKVFLTHREFNCVVQWEAWLIFIDFHAHASISFWYLYDFLSSVYLYSKEIKPELAILFYYSPRCDIKCAICSNPGIFSNNQSLIVVIYEGVTEHEAAGQQEPTDGVTIRLCVIPGGHFFIFIRDIKLI